jgi:hypothetical protein
LSGENSVMGKIFWHVKIVCEVKIVWHVKIVGR